jgi:uncharacterized protein (UPF0264 family)
MTALLVSVRSAAEAEAALDGGAALIDVKEPARGSLGRAELATIAEVVRVVAGRRPVSAALGELREEGGGCPQGPTGLAFLKWGLAGCGGHRTAWEAELRQAALFLRPGCRLVAVAYADWQRAGAPPPWEVLAFACSHPGSPFLLDTWRKDGTTLLDWLPPWQVEEFCRLSRAAGVPAALAGSLGLEEVRALRRAGPDWFAVRGAACQGRDRTAAIDRGKVRALADVLAEELPVGIGADEPQPR